MVKGRTGQRVRLYVRGSILGFKRSKSNQYENTSLMRPLPVPPALSSSPLVLSPVAESNLHRSHSTRLKP
ncbi:60S ribosomal protein L35a-1-like [Hordeum vulgare]|nr:60S ribosomal protein L35a-1-like [Hordeum vulgare]